MEFSNRGAAFLESLEGRFAKVYDDSGGEPTIGVGHLLTKTERRSGNIVLNSGTYNYRNGLSEEVIDELLAHDVDEAERIIADTITAPLTQPQHDALVCFVFNTGTTGNKLRRAINARNFEAVPALWREWCHDNGKVIKGLQNRRAKELAFWASTN